MIVYASKLSEIPQALCNNPAVKERMLVFISTNKISGRVTESSEYATGTFEELSIKPTSLSFSFIGDTT